MATPDVECRGLSPLDAGVKRVFDVCLSSVGLGLAGGLIGLCWLISTIDTRTNGFFTQERIGRHGKPFRVIKLRSMKSSAVLSTTVTTAHDPRITPWGRILRRTKLDELPQLVNVLLGTMSFVGPRPDVPGFADRLEGSDRVVLTVRPGITGPASLHFRDEETLLARQPDPERYNREVLFPEKTRINCQYVQRYRFVDDLKYILWTITGVPDGVRFDTMSKLSPTDVSSSRKGGYS